MSKTTNPNEDDGCLTVLVIAAFALLGLAWCANYYGTPTEWRSCSVEGKSYTPARGGENSAPEQWTVVLEDKNGDIREFNVKDGKLWIRISVGDAVEAKFITGRFIDSDWGPTDIRLTSAERIKR